MGAYFYNEVAARIKEDADKAAKYTDLVAAVSTLR